MVRKKSKYSKEFKEQAVRLSYQRENIKELANELGIQVAHIYKWRRVDKEDSRPKLEVLKKENNSEVIFHSDRGIPYASKKFRKQLKTNCLIIQSMNRKSDCWDNAVVEPFFKTLKLELVCHNDYKTIKQAKNIYLWIYWNLV